MNLRDLDTFDWCPVWAKWLLLVAAVLFALYLSAQAEALATVALDGPSSAVATAPHRAAREGQAGLLVRSSASVWGNTGGGRRGTAAAITSEASRV